MKILIRQLVNAQHVILVINYQTIIVYIVEFLNVLNIKMEVALVVIAILDLRYHKKAIHVVAQYLNVKLMILLLVHVLVVILHIQHMESIIFLYFK